MLRCCSALRQPQRFSRCRRPDHWRAAARARSRSASQRGVQNSMWVGYSAELRAQQVSRCGLLNLVRTAVCKHSRTARIPVNRQSIKRGAHPSPANGLQTLANSYNWVVVVRAIAALAACARQLTPSRQEDGACWSEVRVLSILCASAAPPCKQCTAKRCACCAVRCFGQGASQELGLSPRAELRLREHRNCSATRMLQCRGLAHVARTQNVLAPSSSELRAVLLARRMFGAARSRRRMRLARRQCSLLRWCARSM